MYAEIYAQKERGGASLGALCRKYYKGMDDYKKQSHVWDRLLFYLKKKNDGLYVSFALFFPPSPIDPVRSAAAKKAVITRKKRVLKALLDESEQTLFPSYIAETCPKIALLTKQLQNNKAT